MTSIFDRLNSAGWADEISKLGYKDRQILNNQAVVKQPKDLTDRSKCHVVHYADCLQGL